MKLIVLASTSARRKTLLKQLGLKFTIIPSLVEEKLNPRLKPRGQAEALALLKAQSADEKYRERKNHESYLIIAADTIISVDDEVLGKPKDEKDAKQMLRKLSGRRHCVITGFSIVDTDTRKIITRSVKTFVYFKKLGEREIREYVKREKLSDKAGAYAIQGLGAVFVEKIEGDYFNVVGLPLHALAIELGRLGVSIL
jgi:septum formation protein